MSSLETSITLDDVFAVVAAKRVPLAAELAGYLALEIADGTDAGSGEVDPKTVFVSEEGSVALVRPKKDVITGDAEASVRSLLIRLLDAGGSSTPALGQAARRKPGNGLPALVEELEAALIPVNRAAGRRALARLSREVKRVTQGVGRNASQAKPEPAKAPVSVASPPSLPEPKPMPVPREPTPAPPPLALVAKEPTPAPMPVREPTPAPAIVAKEADLEPPPKHDPLAPTPIAPKPKPTSIPPPPVKSASGPPGPPPMNYREPGPPSALIFEPQPEPLPLPDPTPSPRRARNDDVDALLSSFEVSGGQEDKALARDLKAMAGLSPTPPNPEARSIADLADDVGRGPLPSQRGHDGDSVEALLAMADASLPAPAVSAPALPPVKDLPGAPAIVRKSMADPDPPKKSEKEPFVRTSSAESADPAAPTQRRRSAAEPPRAPKTGMFIMVFLLVALAATTVAIYRYAPHVFVGHKPVVPPAATSATVVAKPAACKLSLVINDVPPRAEILLRVGQAPVDVDHMPVGARLELVATAEGYAPRRAVIAAESQWDKGTDGKPRIEIPIQLDPSKPKPGTIDPWPAAEPNSQVGGAGPPGTVHVVSNVRGAEVWLLAGVGPEAKMEQKCDGDVDVLIAGPPGLRKRLHLGEKELSAAAADAQGNKTVTLSANK